MPKRSRGLTPKERLFVDRYLIHLNATKAAKEAGYSQKTARQAGAQNLSKPVIQVAIEKAMYKRQERTELTQDMIVQELRHVAFSRIRDCMKWDEGGSVVVRASADLTDAQDAAIHSIKEVKGEKSDSMEVRKHDKLKALELLGKHMGMFKDARPPEERDSAAVAGRIQEAVERLKGRRGGKS